MKRILLKKNLVRKTAFNIGKLGIASLLATQFYTGVYAAGYKIEMQSSSVLADAGDAAVVEDAGTNWYNAAGLPYLPQQLVFSTIDVYAPTSFSGTVIAPSPFVPPFVGNGSASSHPNNILPAFHYSYPINQQWAAGLSVVPAWGFSEDYGIASILRFDLVRVNTTSIDIAPSIAYRWNNQWSFGIGPDFHYFLVDSKSMAYMTPGSGTQSRYRADDWAPGAHIGILYRLSETTRIGLNYRTKLVQHLEGFSDLSGIPGLGSMRNNNFKLRVVLPPTTSLSIYHEVTPQWALMGTLAFDQWSVLRNYYANNYQSLGTNGFATIPNVYVPQSMMNTIDIGIGTHYKFNDEWMLRANLKYEPTPTQNQYRDVNFPDGDKLGVQIGARYQMSKKLALDMLYGHVFIRTAPINLTQPVTFVTVNGHNKSSIDLIGAQLVWSV